MKKTDLAYIAGIVDGEGNINIFKRPEIHNGYRVKVGVTNTNPWICQWLHFAFGGHLSLRKRRSIKHKNAWVWEVDSIKACGILKLLLPYLKLKRPQAELAIALQSHMSARHRTRKTPEERLIDDDLYEKIKTLNKKGPTEGDLKRCAETNG